MTSFARGRLFRQKYALIAAFTTALAAIVANRSGSAAPAGGETMAQQAPNTLTAAEKAEGWRLLFDGRTTAGWRGYQSQSMPPGWEVTDGTLRKPGVTADIITLEQFGNFDLRFDW